MKLGLEKRLRAVMSGESATDVNLSGDLEAQAILSPAGFVARRVAWLIARAGQIDSSERDRVIAAHFMALLKPEHR